MNRELHFKLEKLNSSDQVVAEMTPRLLEGNVSLGYNDINRRTCSFELLEPLPDDWMSARWKMYYGIKQAGVINYTPIGVFLPIDPEEIDALDTKRTKYQGVDKAQILMESYSDIPLTFPAGMSLKQVASTILDLIGETKRNLEDVPYTLATEFTFDENVDLEHIMSTLIRSFPADWYYDVNGICVLEALPEPNLRPIRYTFEPGDEAIHIDTTRKIDLKKYWNRVTVIGGTVDTGIFRQTYSSPEGYAQAGRWITRLFKEDTASSQAQINELTAQFLDAGLRLPATITIHNLPLASLQPRDVIMIDNKKYELTDVNVPLSTDLQTLQAGEVI